MDVYFKAPTAVAASFCILNRASFLILLGRWYHDNLAKAMCLCVMGALGSGGASVLLLLATNSKPVHAVALLPQYRQWRQHTGCRMGTVRQIWAYAVRQELCFPGHAVFHVFGGHFNLH